jgi:hypothetical protein
MSEEITPDRTIDVNLSLGRESRDAFTSEMKKVVNPDGTTTWVNVGVNEKSLQKTKDAIKEVPTDKMLEIKLQGEIDKDLATIKANADNLQSAMEWSAKLDIANVEASVEKTKAMFSSIDNTISATSRAATDLLTADWSKMDLSQYMAALNGAADQLKMQKEAHVLQMEMAKAQLKIEEAKLKLLEKKDGSIKIDSTGLEPALEMIMWQIIQKVQIKANEQQANFLLGIG